ncbi:hypothetical protein TAMA11512_14500 [Selenomonas sp. TAMA-11512]|uniref:metal-sensing transcriptional repressor n=1 Tax=Selenomonas sp. TAMA-11512 TaxID=3095337 RepID=UPI003086576E|nr:hypothetical protein TAMA11512_14500 [Selenomonas sp. TAMA-11512]
MNTKENKALDRENERTLLSADRRECPLCEVRYRNKSRGAVQIKSLQNRLNRIIGQMNGIKKMIDDGRYCGDILIQVSAVESALQNFGYVVLESHLESCVADEIKAGHTEIIAETVDLIKKLK